MSNLHFSLGFASISGYDNSSKELQWLLSVFSGIVMCKIVYELTGIVSLSFYKGYTKLNNAEKVEWNNRGFSTVHAVIVSVAAVYLLLISDLFDETSNEELIIDRRSKFSDFILGFSLGYFITDLSMILWYLPALGGKEYVLHHGLSMISILQSLVSGQGLIYILMVLFTESTTPFVNLRWYLDLAGRKNSKLYVFNGVALFFGWLIARILLFVYFFYHMFTHYDQVKEVYTVGFYSLVTIPPIISAMNLFWFWKIAKGMIKTLSKARHIG
jgi:hypothetical protein